MHRIGGKEDLHSVKEQLDGLRTSLSEREAQQGVLASDLEAQEAQVRQGGEDSAQILASCLSLETQLGEIRTKLDGISGSVGDVEHLPTLKDVRELADEIVSERMSDETTLAELQAEAATLTGLASAIVDRLTLQQRHLARQHALHTTVCPVRSTLSLTMPQFVYVRTTSVVGLSLSLYSRAGLPLPHSSPAYREARLGLEVTCTGPDGTAIPLSLTGSDDEEAEDAEAEATVPDAPEQTGPLPLTATLDPLSTGMYRVEACVESLGLSGRTSTYSVSSRMVSLWGYLFASPYARQPQLVSLLSESTNT
ncbi:hypothetical protein KIPB_005023 [Kipferlia bialata]|uniref:Uncharacterized protein n=1 Tax=Kipferlia bialata TaxID=797122 RepID=A0A9K3GGZ4_9EUKA|nr:hypothetical protein KIPB_005023 [Kipferlia bialata]|eukprot:g5023.t1